VQTVDVEIIYRSSRLVRKLWVKLRRRP